jgi:hypothetical protein
MQAMNKRKAVEMTRQAIESTLPEEVVDAENQLEDAQAVGTTKRAKHESTANTNSHTGSADQKPILYQGADGQYYYDYGEYGYNYNTQQYDPARLGQYQGHTSQHLSTLSLQDRVKASLQSPATATTTSVIVPSVLTKEKNVKPAASALGALAAYGSDSEGDDED